MTSPGENFEELGGERGVGEGVQGGWVGHIKTQWERGNGCEGV